MEEEQTLIIDLDQLSFASDGKNESYKINEEVYFDLEVAKSFGPVSMKLTLMKISEGISVSVEDFHCQVKCQCARCLSDTELDINIPYAERVFYFDPSKQEDIDPFDRYLVDTRHQCINIYEMLRQEILLHFPDSPVCSIRCEGICSHCGKSLKESRCSCKKYKEANERPNPFAQLKDLIK